MRSSGDEPAEKSVKGKTYELLGGPHHGARLRLGDVPKGRRPDDFKPPPEVRYESSGSTYERVVGHVGGYVYQHVRST